MGNSEPLGTGVADTHQRKRTVIHWAWVILAVCFLNLFVNYGIRLGYGVVLPEMIRTLGLTRRQGGDIFNSYLFAYVCLSPFAGYLTDRLGARRIISLFGIVLGIGTLFMGMSQSFPASAFFFALVGIGGSAMWTPIIALVQRWFSLKRRGMALGILSTGFGLGFATMGKLFPVIVARWNWQYCWYILGSAALIMVVVNAILLRSKPEDMDLLPWGEKRAASVISASSQRPGTYYRQVLSAPRFWVLGTSYFFVAGALYIITTYMVDYARYNLGFSYETASFLATLHGLGQIVGVLTISFVSDYIGRKMTILLSNLFIAASIVGVIASGTNVTALFTSVTLVGAFYGATFPMYGAAGGDYFRKEIMGTVIGALTLFYGSGAIIANRVAGHIRDTTGSFVIPFVIAVAASFVAAILLLALRAPSQEEEK
jgi:sugar phosphate permease